MMFLQPGEFPVIYFRKVKSPNLSRYPFRDKLDRVFEFLTCIVPNVTLTNQERNYSLDSNRTLMFKDKLVVKRIPKIYSSENGVYALLHERTFFTFLSCSTPISEAISISGLISVYDFKIWILIVVFMLLWPLIISFVENNFSFKNVVQDIDAVFLGFMILLEQSHIRTVNKSKKGALYVFCGCAILVSIVLSNAFKGENINKISSTLKTIQFSTIDQLMENGYDIYCTESFISKNDTHDYSQIEYQMMKKPLSVLPSKLKKVVEYVKIWEYTDNEVYDIQNNEHDSEYYVRAYAAERRPFSVCRRQALLGWNKALNYS